jgi:hypothetical protein
MTPNKLTRERFYANLMWLATIKRTYVLMYSTRYVARFYTNWDFIDRVSQKLQISNFTGIHPLEVALIHAGGQMDGRT